MVSAVKCARSAAAIATTGLVLTASVAGCSSLKKSIDRINRSQEEYSLLQGFIRQRLTTKFHLSVRLVSCTPHVDQVIQSSSAHMKCLVYFTDGTSYTTQGIVTDPSNDPDYVNYNYTFYDPPSVDITKAPLPSPTVSLSAASPKSLLVARNLAV